MSVLTRQVSRIGEKVVAALSSASVDGQAVWITTPLLYPSGAHVVVWFDGTGGTFSVSDYGNGSSEADMMGGGRVFTRVAIDLSEKSGIGFDKNCFYASGVTHDNLVIAVTAIANLSKEAVDQTAYRLAERKYQFEDDELVERLIGIFGKPQVHREAEFVGASNKLWTFSAAVQLKDHQTVFDLVKPLWQSVYPAVAKFRDVSDLVDGPRRVAVLSDRQGTDQTDVNLLSRSAHIIEFAARDDTYRRAA